MVKEVVGVVIDETGRVLSIISSDGRCDDVVVGMVAHNHFPEVFLRDSILPVVSMIDRRATVHVSDRRRHPSAG